MGCATATVANYRRIVFGVVPSTYRVEQATDILLTTFSGRENRKKENSPFFRQEVCERNLRSALSTASESGKISCKSGAISTTFVPWRNRFVCFPRTPDLMSSSGYSSRIFSLSLFICFALARCHFTGRYDADPVTPLSIGYNEVTKC